jgi:hypothetical protein
MKRPTPHLDKLQATLNSSKLPDVDEPSIKRAVVKYHEWIENLKAAKGTPSELISHMVDLLNEYKTFIDLLIFDSSDCWLSRSLVIHLRLHRGVGQRWFT